MIQSSPPPFRFTLRRRGRVASSLIALLPVLASTTILSAPATALPPVPEPKPNAFIQPHAKPDDLGNRTEGAVRVAGGLPYPVAKPPDPGPIGTGYVYLLTPEQRRTFARALDDAEANRWTRAFRAVKDFNNRTPDTILRWLYMIEPGGQASFEDRRIFLEAHRHWPSESELVRQLEYASKSAPTDQVVAWFDDHPPKTSHGMAAYAHALAAEQRTEDAPKAARRAWIEGDYLRADEQRLYNRFKGFLTAEDHAARTDQLIWKRHYTSAARMLRYLDKTTRTIAEARLALARSSPGVDAAIRKVPEELRNDPGIVFERARWRRLKRRPDAAAELLLEVGETKGGEARRWWYERHYLTRQALADGKNADAYRLVSEHGIVPDPDHMADFAAAEWLSGWIALRKLNNPTRALPHFQALFRNVSYPVSLARGAYWMGRTHAAMGEPLQARTWLEQAARHPMTFYGQRAIAELTALEDAPQLPPAPDVTLADVQAMETSDLAQAIRALAEIRNTKYLRRFARALVNQKTDPAWKLLATELADDLSLPGPSVYMARQAAQDYVTLSDLGWPVPDIPYADKPERAAVLAVMRQESGFMETARSHAGARGLMQIMPATARVVARRMGVPYDRNRLLEDPSYNMALGSYYLNGLLEDYDGSYIMALAAYNAGPGRVRRWVRDFGDPRDPGTDPIDWIESISITETRNYVQRVMENLIVYRARLSEDRRLAPAAEPTLQRREKLDLSGAADPSPTRLSEDEQGPRAPSDGTAGQ